MKGTLVDTHRPVSLDRFGIHFGTPTISLIECNDPEARLVLEAAGRMEFWTRRFASALAFLQEFDPLKPGCVVADFHLYERGAWELIEAINLEPPGLSLIFLAREMDAATAIELMKAGVCDILTLPLDAKSFPPRLVRAVDQDLRSKRAFAAQALARHHYSLLTPREREVFQLVVSGLSSKDIAQTLERSQKTVEVHRMSIMKKMNARSVVDLVRLALELHLLDGPYSVKDTRAPASGIMVGAQSPGSRHTDTRPA